MRSPPSVSIGLISMPGRVHRDDEHREAAVLRHRRCSCASESSTYADSCAIVVNIFCPLTIQSSPSRTARVAAAAMSEPASGSRSRGSTSDLAAEDPRQDLAALGLGPAIGRSCGPRARPCPSRPSARRPGRAPRSSRPSRTGRAAEAALLPRPRRRQPAPAPPAPGAGPSRGACRWPRPARRARVGSARRGTPAPRRGTPPLSGLAAGLELPAPAASNRSATTASSSAGSPSASAQALARRKKSCTSYSSMKP